MEKFVQRSLLYDFYGELLTEHQRRIYRAVVFDDYSPAEIAREEGISRQGVHDLMRRCDRALEEYEDRLRLVERFLKIRESVREISELTQAEKAEQPSGGKHAASVEADRMTRIREIAASILEEL